MGLSGQCVDVCLVVHFCHVAPVVIAALHIAIVCIEEASLVLVRWLWLWRGPAELYVVVVIIADSDHIVSRSSCERVRRGGVHGGEERGRSA